MEIEAKDIFSILLGGAAFCVSIWALRESGRSATAAESAARHSERSADVACGKISPALSVTPIQADVLGHGAMLVEIYNFSIEALFIDEITIDSVENSLVFRDWAESETLEDTIRRIVDGLSGLRPYSISYNPSIVLHPRPLGSPEAQKASVRLFAWLPESSDQSQRESVVKIAVRYRQRANTEPVKSLCSTVRVTVGKGGNDWLQSLL
ncbi:MAG: hypothetical protein K2P80_07465 [Beijerinckiaceae bacterium]|nr:hypothetical protein [Beijerinckiaceae bacterium]